MLIVLLSILRKFIQKRIRGHKLILKIYNVLKGGFMKVNINPIHFKIDKKLDEYINEKLKTIKISSRNH